MINRRRRKRTSPPSSRTKTSPCSKGDMVPASMFKYGSAWKRLKDESYYKSVYGKKKKKKREEKLRERENRFWWKWREGHRLWARRLCCWRWRLCRGHWPLRRWWPRISLCDLGWILEMASEGNSLSCWNYRPGESCLELELGELPSGWVL